MKVKAKIWVEDNGKTLFGDGKIALLASVDRHGSLNKAVKEFGMSYLHAEKKIRALERRLNIKLIETTIGGAGGGGSTLTDEAKDLIRRYMRFRAELDTLIQDRFDESFGIPGKHAKNRR